MVFFSSSSSPLVSRAHLSRRPGPERANAENPRVLFIRLKFPPPHRPPGNKHVQYSREFNNFAPNECRTTRETFTDKCCFFFFFRLISAARAIYYYTIFVARTLSPCTGLRVRHLNGAKKKKIKNCRASLFRSTNRVFSPVPVAHAADRQALL